MGNTRPSRSGETVLCIEVEAHRGRGGNAVSVVESLPGREGSFTRRWDLGPAGMDQATWQDLCGWVLKTMLDAITLVGAGVQQEIPTL